MADPSYNIQGVGLHAFLMFAPFFAMYEKRGMMLQGLVLYLTGPVAAALITSNLMEQASIWCFFSIAQICIMLFLIRETLIVNWGRNKSQFTLSSKKGDNGAAAAAAAASTKKLAANGNGNGKKAANGNGKHTD